MEQTKQSSILSSDRTLTAEGIHQPQLLMRGRSSALPGNNRIDTNWWSFSRTSRNLGVDNLKIVRYFYIGIFNIYTVSHFMEVKRGVNEKKM